jgi:RNA polymerase sigma-70 factor (ECF subfamily)
VGSVLGAEFVDVLDRARRGDDTSFALLFRDLQPALVRYLRVAAGPVGEDLASETWVRVAQGLGRFRGDARGFHAWVFTIARHRILDWRRREARAPVVSRPVDELADHAAGDDPAADAIERLDSDPALNLIRTLPADQAEVVVLRTVAGLDVAHVARVVGKRPGIVRALTRRGLLRLAEQLGAEQHRTDPGVVTP